MQPLSAKEKSQLTSELRALDKRERELDDVSLSSRLELLKAAKAALEAKMTETDEATEVYVELAATELQLVEFKQLGLNTEELQQRVVELAAVPHEPTDKAQAVIRVSLNTTERHIAGNNSVRFKFYSVCF